VSDWSTPAALKGQVQRLWDRGLLPAALVGGEALLPKRLTLKGPTSAELAERFAEVRDWVAALRALPHVRLEMRELRHRQLGANLVPAEVWIDNLDAALAWIGKKGDGQRLIALAETTRARLPELTPWVIAHPLRALDLAADWERLLDFCLWLRAHPRPGIHLRQVDLPGIHTKFVEGHRGVLAEWLDRLLPPEAIAPEATGARGFERRYGFAEKPERVRLRVLDPALELLPGTAGEQIELEAATFARFAPGATRVLVTENEIDFLTLPPLPGVVAIFGAGYGFDALAGADWLHDCRVDYWGDLDTHGFAILDQLRALLPHVRSLLMDEATLLAHRAQWVTEERPNTRDLPRLSDAERLVYEGLRDQRWGERVRLEQERIGFGWVLRHL